MWAYVYIWENWLFILCCKENSFQYKNICSWITGALMHKKVRPNNSFRNSKLFKKSHLVTSWPMRKKQQPSLSYRNATTANTIVRAILMQHFHSLSWKIINSYSLASLGSSGTSQSCGLDVRNGFHCVSRDLLSRHLTNRNYILYVAFWDWSFQGACFSICSRMCVTHWFTCYYW